jgi:hypothetical protein
MASLLRTTCIWRQSYLLMVNVTHEQASFLSTLHTCILGLFLVQSWWCYSRKGKIHSLEMHMHYNKQKREKDPHFENTRTCISNLEVLWCRLQIPTKSVLVRVVAWITSQLWFVHVKYLGMPTSLWPRTPKLLRIRDKSWTFPRDWSSRCSWKFCLAVEGNNKEKLNAQEILII